MISCGTLAHATPGATDPNGAYQAAKAVWLAAMKAQWALYNAVRRNLATYQEYEDALQRVYAARAAMQAAKQAIS